MTMNTNAAAYPIFSFACEPLAGKRMVKVTERKTALDWACFMEDVAAQYEHAEKITLVMDNFSTHNAGSFYEKFAPDKAKALMDRFDFGSCMWGTEKR